MAGYTATYRGLTLGPDTDYEITEINGFFDRDVNLLSPDLPRYHGGLVGASYHNPRALILDIEVTGEAFSAGQVANRWAIQEAFQPLIDSEDPFTLELPDGATYRIECRVRRGSGPITLDAEAGIAAFSYELVASDPAIYDNALTSLTLTPFTSASGFSWSAVWPIQWGAAGTGGTGQFTNSGTWETWPTFTISGPSSGTLTNPVIEDVTNGKEIALTANGGVSMTSGQSLVIQTHPAERFIAFDTGASRRGKLSDDSEWFPLDAGATELRFRASGTTAGASVLVEARSARI